MKSLKLADAVGGAAERIRSALGFDVAARREAPGWSEALKMFASQADDLGVLVMGNSVVGSNTHWPLDVNEFRGFALSDDRAPLVFINTADSRSAQMFTLAHELAHIWLGRSALSDAPPDSTPEHSVERWCNAVAAELLVPLANIRKEFRGSDPLDGEVKRLSREFKVSTLVVLRRIRDGGGIGKATFEAAYSEELDRLHQIVRGGGGQYYPTQVARVGRRFTRALVSSALEGQTLTRDAMRLLGVAKPQTMVNLGKAVGVG